MRVAIWAAAGFEDTELDVNMEPEEGHGATEVYAGVQARGCEADQRTRVSVAEASRDLGYRLAGRRCAV